MVDLVSALFAGLLATFIPLFVGLFFPYRLTKYRGGQRAQTFRAALSVGISFWFFVDVMGDAALLDVNQGFKADDYFQAASHIVLALLFAVGLATLFVLDRHYAKGGIDDTTVVKGLGNQVIFTFAIASVAALGVGFHALGEG